MNPKQPSALTISEVAIDELKADPANPRRISDAELEALTRSLREFGLVDPIIARASDRTVIGRPPTLTCRPKAGTKDSAGYLPGCL